MRVTTASGRSMRTRLLRASALPVLALAMAGAQPALAQSGAPPAQLHVLNLVTGDPGSYLVGEAGMTLYYFRPDSPGVSACYDKCATNWPPYLLEADEVIAPGAGVTGVIGTIPRTDGTMQVSYDGRPLYYFIKDVAAGDTTGQGVGDVWFVAAENGSMPAPVPASPAP
jgi:predicted lipoprotein with Yx(FWY)xxD motif